MSVCTFIVFPKVILAWRESFLSLGLCSDFVTRMTQEAWKYGNWFSISVTEILDRNNVCCKIRVRVILESSFHSDMVHGGNRELHLVVDRTQAEPTASDQRSTAPTVAPVIFQRFYHLSKQCHQEGTQVILLGHLSQSITMYEKTRIVFKFLFWRTVNFC